jgi:ascorbate-specific PTS system EIIC-type component UlaA
VPEVIANVGSGLNAAVIVTFSSGIVKVLVAPVPVTTTLAGKTEKELSSFPGSAVIVTFTVVSGSATFGTVIVPFPVLLTIIVRGCGTNSILPIHITWLPVTVLIRQPVIIISSRLVNESPAVFLKSSSENKTVLQPLSCVAF